MSPTLIHCHLASHLVNPSTPLNTENVGCHCPAAIYLIVPLHCVYSSMRIVSLYPWENCFINKYSAYVQFALRLVLQKILSLAKLFRSSSPCLPYPHFCAPVPRFVIKLDCFGTFSILFRVSPMS